MKPVPRRLTLIARSLDGAPRSGLSSGVVALLIFIAVALLVALVRIGF